MNLNERFSLAETNALCKQDTKKRNLTCTGSLSGLLGSEGTWKRNSVRWTAASSFWWNSRVTSFLLVVECDTLVRGTSNATCWSTSKFKAFPAKKKVEQCCLLPFTHASHMTATYQGNLQKPAPNNHLKKSYLQTWQDPSSIPLKTCPPFPVLVHKSLTETYSACHNPETK